ncbi:uncharacterized protein NPIL_169751 [Nephila pilipes]|uniref:Uncharacterized protein n=1 Tax=Nephila pilipes TaxID=299642 RepID=A0A8X6ILG8_NEPPI|nr:uncharacterized protein NPIL_169751 [Nephila pilipes]
MIPTFQLGAKTNRRALQSKFKSWARRMAVTNGNLVLSSTGKIIIPEEKCEKLIMEIHSKNHLSVDQVVAQIQRNYTWQKKNFGMDLEIVMNIISANCEKDECRYEIGKEFKTYKKKIYSAVPVSSISWPIFQEPKHDSFELYKYSRDFLPGNKFSSSNFPVLKNYLNRKYTSANYLTESPNATSSKIPMAMRNKRPKNYEEVIIPKSMKHFGGFAEKDATRSKFLLPNPKPMRKCHVPEAVSLIEKKPEKLLNSNQNYLSESLNSWDSYDSHDKNATELYSTPSYSMHENGSYFTKEDGNSSKHSRMFTKACKKPRTLFEFKILLKEAQNDSETHPAILTSSKTQFLGTLGLVPKRICSQRTLTKFGRELRKKHLMEKGRGRFVERKVLRDRNKLNRRSSYRLKMKHQAYVDFSKSSYHRTAIDSTKRMKNSSVKKFKAATKRSLKHYLEKSKEIVRKVTPSIEITKKEPEVIDIASSDDGKDEQNDETRKVMSNSPESDHENPTSSATSSVKSDSVTNPKLFGYDPKNAEALRSQMFFGQNIGYGNTFENRNVFLNQNNITNLLIPSNKASEQRNESFYLSNQAQFPVLRPIFKDEQIDETQRVMSNSPEPDHENPTSTATSSVRSDSVTNPKLFGYDPKNAEALRSQMFFGQNLGYRSTFENRNRFLNQNNITNHLIPSNNASDQRNESFYRSNQAQFPVLRPIFIPALTNGDVAVLQVPPFSLVRPIRPINSSNVPAYFPKIRPIQKNIDAFNKQLNKSPTEESHASMPDGNSSAKSEKINANVTPMYHVNATPSEFKIFLVNKAQKKALLLIPPNTQTFPKEIGKTIPTTVRKIAPRINDFQKIPLDSNDTAKKENEQRKENNMIYANTTYGGKRKEPKKDILVEMKRFTSWINILKSNITRTSFQRGVDKFSQRLTNQLNVGINLVKNIRNNLIEIEKNEEIPEEDTIQNGMKMQACNNSLLTEAKIFTSEKEKLLMKEE